jgi:hypothetical protein
MGLFAQWGDVHQMAAEVEQLAVVDFAGRHRRRPPRRSVYRRRSPGGSPFGAADAPKHLGHQV